MRRICVIGDIHGRTNWQRINLPAFDKVIFLGDYFDPYERKTHEELWDNFEKIIDLKGKEPDKYVLLFGNHDYHYLPKVRSNPYGDRYSRFDYNLENALGIGKVLEAGLEAGTLQIAYHLPDSPLFFIHAGISRFWYTRMILENDVPAEGQVVVEDLDKLADQINHLPLGAFSFYMASGDVYGYDSIQGPLWWRPREWSGRARPSGLETNMIQVIGHTQTNMPEIYREEGFVFADCLDNNRFLEIQIEGDEITFHPSIIFPKATRNGENTD